MFKIGDRVKVVDTDHSPAGENMRNQVGNIGTILNIPFKTTGIVRVDISGRHKLWFRPKRLSTRVIYHYSRYL